MPKTAKMVKRKPKVRNPKTKPLEELNQLNERYELFCKEYLVDFSATHAAIRAGYSEKTARTQGSALLTKIDIQNRIGELTAIRFKKMEDKGIKVLEALAEVGFSDISQYFNSDKNGAITFKGWDGIKNSKAISKIKIQNVTKTDKKGVQKTVGYISEFSLWDKNKALEMLGKYHKLFADNILINNDVDIKYEVLMIEKPKTGMDWAGMVEGIRPK